MRTLVILVCVLLLSGCAVSAASAGSESSKKLEVRLDHSQDVIQFFHKRAWMRAPRQEKCWKFRGHAHARLHDVRMRGTR